MVIWVGCNVCEARRNEAKGIKSRVLGDRSRNWVVKFESCPSHTHWDSQFWGVLVSS